MQNVAGFDNLVGAGVRYPPKSLGHGAESDILGQKSPPGAAAQRERGSGQRGGAPGRGQKRKEEKKEEEKDYLVGVRRNKQIAPHFQQKFLHFATILPKLLNKLPTIFCIIVLTNSP